MPDFGFPRRDATSSTSTSADHMEVRSSFHSRPRPAVRQGALLALDPELGRLLSAERHARARVELHARVLRRKPGPWLVDGTAAEADAYVRLLILDGVVARDVSLEDVISTELLGSGDVIRPGTAGDADRLLGDQTSWSVLAECRVAVIDERCAQTLSAYPEVTTVLLERLERRRSQTAGESAGDRRAHPRGSSAAGDALATRRAVGPRDRRRRPAPAGHLAPPARPARGCTRPTISTAAAELARQGLLRRRDDGASAAAR